MVFLLYAIHVFVRACVRARLCVCVSDKCSFNRDGFSSHAFDGLGVCCSLCRLNHTLSRTLGIQMREKEEHFIVVMRSFVSGPFTPSSISHHSASATAPATATVLQTVIH